MYQSIYTYPFNNPRVIDGDSIEGDFDLGFKMTMRKNARLFGINCPGRFTEAGKEATQALKELIEGKQLYVVSERDTSGKYGRPLVTLFISSPDGNDVNVNQWLLDNGYAVIY